MFFFNSSSEYILSQANQVICLIVWFKGFMSFMVIERLHTCTLSLFVRKQQLSRNIFSSCAGITISLHVRSVSPLNCPRSPPPPRYLNNRRLVTPRPCYSYYSSVKSNRVGVDFVMVDTRNKLVIAWI